MTITQELIDFRVDNSVDIAQLSDVVWLRYYNDWRDILIDKIISIKEDFFYNYITWNIAINQVEYTIPLRWDLDWAGNPMWWLIKLKSLSRKFKTTDTEFSKIDGRVLENLENDLETYETLNEEFFTLSDNSVFLYPKPTESITWWLKMYGIIYPIKLAIWDTETILSQYKKAILVYVAYRYFSWRSMYNEAQMQLNLFYAECDRIATSLSWRIQSPKPRTLPSLSHLT